MSREEGGNTKPIKFDVSQTESTTVGWALGPNEPGTVNVRRQETDEEFFKRCFFEPLRRMTVDNNETFIVLMVLLPLYEKYWRVANAHNKIGLPSKFHNSLAADLNLTFEQAQSFWGLFRHGLAHRAGIKQGVLVSEGRAIETTEDGFKVNPFAL